MKKIVVIIILIAICLLLSGCTENVKDVTSLPNFADPRMYNKVNSGELEISVEWPTYEQLYGTKEIECHQ